MNRIAYNVLISAFVALGLALALVSCGDDPVSDNKDKTPPTVTSTLPADGDSTVSPGSQIRVTFSEAMDPASMIASTLVLDPPVAGTVGYANRILTLTPSGALDTNVAYLATVTTAAKDTAGNALAAAYSWEFTTYLDTIRPTVTATTPPDGDSTTANSVIVVVFSELMDTLALNATTITFEPPVSGTFTYTNRTQVTITPDQPLDLPADYTGTISTAVRDSAGNFLAAPYVWHFRTVADAVPPTAEMTTPVENAVFKDSLLIQVAASDNDRIDRVEFYADGAHIVGADDTTYPYEGYWKPVGLTLGTEHTVYAVAYDVSGNSVATDTITVHYLWRLLVVDNNEPNIPRNLARIYVRSSSLKLQFRVETYNGWGIYDDPATGIDVAIFLDVDRNSTTGARSTGGGTIPIGDIGADYRLVVGNHGDSVGRWNGTAWVAHGLTENLVIENNSNFFEVSVSLARIGLPLSVDLITANVVKDTTAVLVWDWAPNIPLGHVSVDVDRTFSGAPPGATAVRGVTSKVGPSPFD
jgi:hypothetical protein